MERNQHTFTAYEWIQEERKKIFLLITRMLSLQLKFKLDEKSDIAKVENYWMMAGDDYVWGPGFEQLLKEKRTSTDSNNDYLDLPPETSSPIQDSPLIGPPLPPFAVFDVNQTIDSQPKVSVQSPQTLPTQLNFSSAYYAFEELPTVIPMDATSTLVYSAPPSMPPVNTTPASSASSCFR